MDLLVDYLLIRLHGVVVCEYETNFNSMWFIVDSNITNLCRCNRSAMLTYLHMHANASSCLLEREGKMTDIHISRPPTIVRVHKHTYISGRASLTYFQEYLPYMYTQVAVYWRVE